MEIKAINSISKPKLPKAYSYVLRSSQLDNLLISNNITIHTDLVYWLPQIIGSILEVHYWLPNNKVLYPRLYVRAGALPEFSRWLKDISKHDCDALYFKAI